MKSIPPANFYQMRVTITRHSRWVLPSTSTWSGSWRNVKMASTSQMVMRDSEHVVLWHWYFSCFSNFLMILYFPLLSWAVERKKETKFPNYWSVKKLITYFNFYFSQISFFLSSYIVPLTLISILYVGMLIRLWHSAPGSKVSAESRRGKKRVTRMVVFVVLGEFSISLEISRISTK